MARGKLAVRGERTSSYGMRGRSAVRRDVQLERLLVEVRALKTEFSQEITRLSEVRSSWELVVRALENTSAGPTSRRHGGNLPETEGQASALAGVVVAMDRMSGVSCERHAPVFTAAGWVCALCGKLLEAARPVVVSAVEPEGV